MSAESTSRDKAVPLARRARTVIQALKDVCDCVRTGIAHRVRRVAVKCPMAAHKSSLRTPLRRAGRKVLNFNRLLYLYLIVLTTTLDTAVDRTTVNTAERYHESIQASGRDEKISSCLRRGVNIYLSGRRAVSTTATT